MFTTDLTIIGSGGHGRVVADIAQETGYKTIQMVDESYPETQESGVWKVVSANFEGLDGDVVVGIGDNRTRMRILSQLDKTAATLVHPTAHVSRHAVIGEGSVICAGAIVGAFATLGRGCIVNTGASVDHDCIIKDGVHISPGARLAGTVYVGLYSWVGIGACIREGKNIGANVIIGAGAAVITDIPDAKRMGGVPAREF